MRQDIPTGFAVSIGLMLILPLLNYFRDAPIGDFYGEWLSAVSFAVAVFFVVPSTGKRVAVSVSLFLVPLVIVAVLLAQHASGRIPYAYDWITWSAYLTLLVLAYLVGQGLREGRLVREATNRLASALLLVGSTNFALQLIQVAGFDNRLAPFVVPLTESACRATGNVGQANHATSLAWMAAFGALYLFAVGRMRAWVAVPLVASMLLSSALTVSRMAWLFLALGIVIVLAFRAWPAQTARQRRLTGLLLAVGFVVATVASSFLLQSMSEACGAAVRRLTNTQEAGLTIRLTLWRQAIEVWQSHPWLGAGAGMFMATAYWLQPTGVHQQLDYYAHNVALQILAEFGIFAGLAIGVSVVWWGVALFRQRRGLAAPDVVLLYWVGVLWIHSMLEFPLFFVHFLILFGLSIGLIVPPAVARPSVQIPLRVTSATLALLVAAGCALALVDYRRLDRVAYLVTVQMANSFGTNREVEEILGAARADVRIYEPMADHALQLLTPMTDENLAAKIAATDRLISKAPTSAAVLRRIALAMLAGDRATASWHAHRLVMFFPHSAPDLFRNLEAHFVKRPDIQDQLKLIFEEALAATPPVRW